MKIYRLTIILFTFCLLQYSFCSAQNLIPNGSFEQGDSVTTDEFIYSVDSTCSVNTGTVLPGVISWKVAYGAPGRFYHGSPHFVWCYDNIHADSGNAYVGFNGHEGVYVTLDSTLITGHVYELKYYACLDSGAYFYFISQGYPDSTWMTFTFNNGGNTFNSPAIKYEGFGAWQKYDTTFVANANSNEFEFEGNGVSPFGIYVDNFSLQDLGMITSIKESELNLKPTIYLNSENNLLNIIFYNHLLNTVAVFNTSGQCIYKVTTKDEKMEIPMNNQRTGIYYVSVYSNNSVYSKKILITKTY